MQITRGKINRPQRVAIYGPEGIGKSTVASLFPNPVFVDVEQGTSQLNVARTPVPSSFTMLQQIVANLTQDVQGHNTFVLDTADAAERLGIIHICSQHNMSSLGGQEDYGRSYNLLGELWAKFLDSLTNLSMKQGVHIVLLAHAQMRKFELPEEAGKFDRWEMKLERKTSALMKEWPDMLLFANYKTLVVEVKKTKKAQGGERVLYTSHHPCWDAKNRHSLPDEIPLAFEPLAHIFTNNMPSPQTQQAITPPTSKPSEQQPKPQEDSHGTIPESKPTIPESLIQLMESSGVTEKEIRSAVHYCGYYPMETPITNYASEFIEGKLVASWEAVHGVIVKMRKAGGQS